MSETIALIANISLALSFVAALIFGITQAKAAARDRKERFTLETLRFYQSREFAELSVYIIQSKIPKTRDELNALSREERILFTDFSQKMESIGLLVSEGLVDLDLVDKTLGDFVVTAWKKYAPLFLNLRKSIPDPYLGEYFQLLAKRMDRTMKSEDHRRPVHEAELDAINSG